MRFLTDHKVNPANDVLMIAVMDEPGAGGANHRYEITGFDTTNNPSDTSMVEGVKSGYEGVEILFQNGPIAECGVNGVTQEALLAIVADRLRSFQAGAYANEYNATALAHVEAAQSSLLARTRERMGRGVEGTHAK